MKNKDKESDKNKIDTQKLMFDLLEEIYDTDQEKAYVFTFSQDNSLLGKDLISVGGFSAVYIDLKVLFKRVLMHNGCKFLLVHNHPTQNTDPSDADIEMTERIDYISKEMDLQMLDHIILGQGKIKSIKAHIKKLKEGK